MFAGYSSEWVNLAFFTWWTIPITQKTLQLARSCRHACSIVYYEFNFFWNGSGQIPLGVATLSFAQWRDHARRFFYRYRSSQQRD